MWPVVLMLLAQLSDGGAAPLPTPTAALIARTQKNEKVEQLLDDGWHVRFGTADKGPVHLWRPTFYRPEKASLVIYLHGYFTDVDAAFVEHQLAAKFRDSGKNALFVLPEVPSGRSDGPVWKDLDALLTAVFANLKVKPPEGPVTVVGHSGAYRSVLEWLTHPKLERVVLLDGFYGGDKDFQAWTESSDAGPRQLILVGFETAQRSDLFLKKQPDAVRVDDVPRLFDRLTPAQLKARVLYLQSERFDHMGQVTDGRLLPWLLHALP